MATFLLGIFTAITKTDYREKQQRESFQRSGKVCISSVTVVSPGQETVKTHPIKQIHLIV